MNNQKIIPIFYACDDNFVRYTMVSIVSMKEHASKDYQYHVHILNTGLSKTLVGKLMGLENENFHFFFDDVTEYLCSIQDRLPIRDYYSITTYYRIFMADMFPEYDKALYIDSDTIVKKDISILYNSELGDNYVGGMPDQVVVQDSLFAEYVEKVLGVERTKYFNAGVLLFNCRVFREESVSTQILDLINRYTFIVAQDQDYLNVICKDRVAWLDPIWNAELFGTPVNTEEEIGLIHYNFGVKPWNNKEGQYVDYFWHYAKMSPCYEDIEKQCASYTKEQNEADAAVGISLLAMARQEIDKEFNYLNIQNRSQNLTRSRIDVLKKISVFEQSGRFDEDVEEDPPARALRPDQIDYLRDDLYYRINAKIGHCMGRHFMNSMTKKKQFLVKEIRGAENIKNLNSGAIITCNHFNALDSFAIEEAYEAAEQPNRKFYRVIREGNYTSFKGFFGFLMRHYYTLPLSSDSRTMRKFVTAINEILKQGHFILFYPEQSMWWNYRKPKPLKNGAYTFASKNKVPVLPCFITMENTDTLDENGFYVQAYTIHIGEPIYPDPAKSNFQNMEDMKGKNFLQWKNIYEDFYGKPLKYTCDPALLKNVPME